MAKIIRTVEDFNKAFKNQVPHSSNEKPFDAKKFNGIMKIREDAVEIQRKLRS